VRSALSRHGSSLRFPLQTLLTGDHFG